MTNENQFSYSLAMNFVRFINRDNDSPIIFVVDRVLALMSGIGKHFPASHILLCVWRIEKNTVRKCTAYFPNEEGWKVFMKEWRAIMYARSEDSLSELLKCFELRTESAIVKYIFDTWIPKKEMFSVHVLTP